MFKLGEGTGAIFVTTPFAELVVERQLTGVQLLALRVFQWDFSLDFRTESWWRWRPVGMWTSRPPSL